MLRAELKRLPKLIKSRLKEGHKEALLEAIEMSCEIDTLNWILSDED